MTKTKERIKLSGVPVFCRYDEVRKVAELRENPRNPNTHPRYQIERLAKIIKMTGWRAPITISDLSGLIVKGHGRLAAAKLAGFEEIPVEIQHYDSHELENADLIADNYIAELAELDENTLKDLLRELEKSDEIPMTLTGLSMMEIEDLLNPIPADIPDVMAPDRENAGGIEQMNTIKFKSLKIALTDDEAERFQTFYNAFLNANGCAFGLFMELLTNGDKQYAS